jgi:hypothetical protein
MATIAEQLRQTINVERDLPWLRQDVLRDLQGRGKWYAICDTHNHDVKNYAIPAKYFTPVCEWARREGLHAEAHYNGYGVRGIVITF